MDEKLERALGEREGAVVELTRELVAFPTINPPGEAYTPCAEFLGRRLAASGFEIAAGVAEAFFERASQPDDRAPEQTIERAHRLPDRTDRPRQRQYPRRNDKPRGPRDKGGRSERRSDGDRGGLRVPRRSRG